MKTVPIYALSVGRFIAQIFVSISLIMVLGLSISFADTLPLASSEIGVSGLLGGSTSMGPLSQGLSLSYDRDEWKSNGAGGLQYRQEAASVSTTIGPVGTVDASAAALVSGSLGENAVADASGGVFFYFRIEQINVPPSAPSTLPVYYATHGQGSIVGYGSVQVNSSIVQTIEQHIVLTNGPITQSFDTATTLQLAPTYMYEVVLAASCSVVAGVGNSDGYSWAAAAVDPIIRLDQAAFDAGGGSFPLADYYQIDFSPNMVPVPPTVLLLGSGLLGLAGWRRLKRG